MTFISFPEGKHYIGTIGHRPDINKLAFRLAHINRFCGAAGQYSVAQHSCYVASVLSPELRLAGLLHDLHEAYMGDIVSPIKRQSGELVDLERRYLNQIDRLYGVETRHPAVIDADMAVLSAEAQYFQLRTVGWDLPDPAEITIDPWHPHHALYMFSLMFKELTA